MEQQLLRQLYALEKDITSIMVPTQNYFITTSFALSHPVIRVIVMEVRFKHTSRPRPIRHSRRGRGVNRHLIK